MHTSNHVSKLTHRAIALAALSLSPVFAAELIYREDFNTDGVPSGRYTVSGGDVYEVDRRAELNDQNQLGPVYWARNTEVSFVGVPAPTLARRMAFSWSPATTSEETNETMLGLFESSVRWLLNGSER